MIDQCIFNVYKRDERVIIPEFGAIIYSDYSDEADFNAFLTFDDGKVVAEIQKQQSISEDEAVKALEDYVKGITKEIEKGNPVLIEGIGYLGKDEQGTITVQKTASPEAIPPEENSSDEAVENPETIPEPVNETSSDEVMKEEESMEEGVSENELNSATDDELEEVEAEVKEEIVEENEPDLFMEESTTINDQEEFDTAEQEELEESEQENRYSQEIGGSAGNTFIHGDEIQLEEEDSKEEEVSQNRSTYFYEEERKSPVKTFLLIGIPLLLILGGGYYYFFHYEKEAVVNRPPEKSTIAAEVTSPKENEEKTAIKDTTQSESASEKSTTSEKKTTSAERSSDLASVKYEVTEKNTKSNASSTPTPAINSGTPAGGNYYHLILGSFKVESNADNYTRLLQSQGLNVNKFLGKNNYYFVGFENIGSKTEATQRLSEVREENPTAWIINRDLVGL